MPFHGCIVVIKRSGADGSTFPLVNEVIIYFRWRILTYTSSSTRKSNKVFVHTSSSVREYKRLCARSELPYSSRTEALMCANYKGDHNRIPQSIYFASTKHFRFEHSFEVNSIKCMERSLLQLVKISLCKFASMVTRKIISGMFAWTRWWLRYQDPAVHRLQGAL